MDRPFALGVGISVVVAVGGAWILGGLSFDATDEAAGEAAFGAEVPAPAGRTSLVPAGRDAPGLASGGAPPVDRDTAAWRCREGIPAIQDDAQATALGIHVTGVVRCADGEPVPPSGLLGLTGRGEPASRAELVDGAFEVWVARDGVYEVTVEFGDDVVTVPRVEVVAGVPVTVELPPRQRARVRVVDDRGAPVRGARVHGVGRSPSSPFPTAPPAAETELDGPGLASAADGVAELPASWSAWDVVVDAPGWARARASVAAGSSPTLVVLDRGGDVEVTVVRSPRRAPRVRYVDAKGDVTWGDVTWGDGDASGHARSPSLPVGVVRIDGFEVGGAAPIASAEVAVVAGRTVSATLDVPTPARPSALAATVDVEGSVRVPIAWARRYEGEAWTLSLVPRGGGPDRAGRRTLFPPSRDGWFAFDFAAVEAGAYDAVVDPVGWRVPITIDAGSRRFDLTVPRPVRVRVDVVDDLTGAPVALDVRTARVDDRGFDPPQGPVGGAGAIPGTLDLLPTATWRTVVSATGYAPTVLDLGPFGTEERRDPVVVRLKAAGVVRVLARVDGRAVPVRWVQWGVSADDVARHARADTDGRFAGFPLGPVWVVPVLEIPLDPLVDDVGVAPLRPQRAEVRSGETTVVEFEGTAAPGTK